MHGPVGHLSDAKEERFICPPQQKGVKSSHATTHFAPEFPLRVTRKVRTAGSAGRRGRRLPGRVRVLRAAHAGQAGGELLAGGAVQQPPAGQPAHRQGAGWLAAHPGAPPMSFLASFFFFLGPFSKLMRAQASV